MKKKTKEKEEEEARNRIRLKWRYNSMIAHWLGWVYVPAFDETEGPKWIQPGTTNATPKGPPEFLWSYDAMFDALAKLTEAQWHEFGEFLLMKVGYSDDYYDGWTMNQGVVKDIIKADLVVIAEALFSTLHIQYQQ